MPFTIQHGILVGTVKTCVCVCAWPWFAKVNPMAYTRTSRLANTSGRPGAYLVYLDEINIACHHKDFGIDNSNIKFFLSFNYPLKSQLLHHKIGRSLETLLKRRRAQLRNTGRMNASKSSQKLV